MHRGVNKAEESWERTRQRRDSDPIKFKIELRDSVNSGKKTLFLNDQVIIFKTKM